MHECAVILFSVRRLANTLSSRTQLPNVAVLGWWSEAGPAVLSRVTRIKLTIMSYSHNSPCRLSGVAPEISKVAVGLGVG